MIKKATLDDVKVITEMLYAMYHEVSPEIALNHILNDYVYFDNRGFFIVKDETLPIHNKKFWNGVSVYVKPEFRASKALKEYYDVLFNTFEGTIMGFTEVNSLHNKVLMKRHKLLGYVYELNRS
jgi:hypothetical protein